MAQPSKKIRFAVQEIVRYEENGTGAKRGKNGRSAALTLDYVFAGPVYYAFDPHAVKRLLLERGLFLRRFRSRRSWRASCVLIAFLFRPDMFFLGRGR